MVAYVHGAVSLERGQLLRGRRHGRDTLRPEFQFRHPYIVQVGTLRHIHPCRAQVGIEFGSPYLSLDRKHAGYRLFGPQRPFVILIERQHHGQVGPQVKLARQGDGSGRSFGQGDGVDTHAAYVGGFGEVQRNDIVFRIDIGGFACEALPRHTENLQHDYRVGNVVPDTRHGGQHRQHQQQSTESLHSDRNSKDGNSNLS